MVSESDNEDDAARLFAGDSARILGPAPTEMEGGAEFDGDFGGVAIVLKQLRTSAAQRARLKVSMIDKLNMERMHPILKIVSNLHIAWKGSFPQSDSEQVVVHIYIGSFLKVVIVPCKNISKPKLRSK